jgi:hypothetical protein
MAPPPTDAPDGAPPATPTSPARAPLVAPPARAVAPSADDDALLLSALDAVSRSTPFARTPATGGAKRLAFSTPATTPLGPGAKAAATPASGLKVPGHDGDMCAVCYSPLAREGRGKTRAPGAFEDRDDDGFSDAASNPSDGASDPKAELFTTACAHVFHRCCLVRCREADFSTCPMCRAALPPGLTPEHVREARAARRLEEARNARQNAIVGAAARAREAVRAQYVRSVVNGTRSGIPGIRRGSQGPAVGRISEEAETEGVQTNASGEMPPWMSPPRSRTTGGGGGGRSASGGGGSAPATPARVPAAREGFVTAAEDLRRRAEAAELAVSVAYGVASAPSTPARGLGGGREGAEGLGPEETPLGRVGTVGSVVGDATAGPGNAATLAGVALADADFFRNAAAALLREESTSTSTRGGRSRDDGEDGEDEDEDAVAIALGAEGSGSAAGSARFRTAAEELARRAEASSFAAALLVANGTASAPATPATGRGVGARGRPALSAAFDAAEAAAAEGDDDAARRALRLARRLEAFEA